MAQLCVKPLTSLLPVGTGTDLETTLLNDLEGDANGGSRCIRKAGVDNIPLQAHHHAGEEGDPYDGVLDLPHGHSCMVVPLSALVQDTMGVRPSGPKGAYS